MLSSTLVTNRTWLLDTWNVTSATEFFPQHEIFVQYSHMINDEHIEQFNSGVSAGI